MARISRIVIPGLPHHVTQRGNRRCEVFFEPADRQHYLALFRKYASEYGVEVWAYSLMTNHVHFVLVPERLDSLSQALRDTHTAYALRFNLQNRLSGHLWQWRFFSCVLDDEHLWAAVRYVERNAVRAGMVARAEQYPWSSAAAHCRLRPDELLSPRFPPAHRLKNWSEWLSGEESAQTQAIRRQTHTGRPCGSADFLADLESRCSRQLRPRKRGRKPVPTEPESLFLDFSTSGNS
jgi:REP-associated tyrosine transposase